MEKSSVKTASKKTTNKEIGILDSIINRALALTMNMIYLANHREDKSKGDPKVGGHPATCASSIHILSALHLVNRNPQDIIVNKPHGSPADHSLNYLMRLFRNPDGSKMDDSNSQVAMKGLRHFSTNGEPVFQSYHSAWDPDHWNFLPSGSVGIPPVQALYMAEAYNMASKHKMYNVPEDTHFWCLIGDSEFREGSLLEAMPEAAERELGNLTWIIDYNRQSLDGNRTFSESELGHKDSDRIEGLALANGWDVVQIKHGRFRQNVFETFKEGESIHKILEEAMPDSELQSLLTVEDSKLIINAIAKYDKAAAKDLESNLNSKDIIKFIRDLGGHDLNEIIETLEFARENKEKPTLLLVHTIKGWGLNCSAKSSNHSAMIDEKELNSLLSSSGSKSSDLFKFERFPDSSPEGKYLSERGNELWKGYEKAWEMRDKNKTKFMNALKQDSWFEKTPVDMNVNLKLVPWAHTQWMLGQITAKLNRIGDAGLSKQTDKLKDSEKVWKSIASQIVTMAPDVGTSTNLNASMDGKTFGPETEIFDDVYGVNDPKSPEIAPNESSLSRHLRFEIAEANTMSCMGSFGKMAELTGVPFIPIMTIYDFFIKRALDQLFYDAYWNSHFILVGTPSGVSLSPEGAQHCWKNDLQIANLISWEPAFALEFDWVMTESIKRHVNTYCFGEDHPASSKGRSGVVVRAVTRAIDQKDLMKRLKTHKRFEGKSEAEILEATRKDCLKGAYYVVDYRDTPEYKPSENVVNIFSMGTLLTEATKASDELKKEGILANVIQVSSNDLLLGNLAVENNYDHLRNGLKVNGDLYLSFDKGSSKSKDQGNYPPTQFGPSPAEQSQFLSMAARRIPAVSVHDGEPGLLDNIGSATGTLQKCLSVRKHSKSGIPKEIYKYHKIDSNAVLDACKEVLQESAYHDLKIDKDSLQKIFS